jgi:hypothetical protein
LAKTLDEIPPELIDATWKSEAMPEEAWQQLAGGDDIECLWGQWSRDAETTLTLAGALEGRAEIARGCVPKFRLGESAKFKGQSTEERRLRRHIRRLKEARLQLSLRGSVQHGLAGACLRSQVQLGGEPFNCCSGVALADADAWSRAQLTKLLARASSQRVRAWKEKLQDERAAAAWVRQEAPAIPAVSAPDGRTAGTPAACAHLLHDWWENLLTRPDAPRATEVRDRFLDAYRVELEEIKARPAPDAPPAMSLDMLRRALRKGRGKARGPDHWAAAELLLLPDAALQRLVEVLTHIENHGSWPAALLHWRLAYIPKPAKDVPGTGEFRTPLAGEVRPIGVGAVVYRAWATCRAPILKDMLNRRVARWHMGGTDGTDAEVLLAAFAATTPPEQYPFAACLDFQKAFDSVEPEIVLTVLRELQLPRGILGPMTHAWQHQVRWSGFAGAMWPVPMLGARGLPQGDPLSPCGLAVLLLLPALRAQRGLRDVVNYIYLDDRTVAARTLPALLAALQQWDEFSQTSGLKEHAGKRQVWGRTQAATEALQQHGIAITDEPEMLGATAVPGPRALSERELGRKRKVEAKAHKIARLPSATAVRARIAASCLTPAQVWGTLSSGRGIRKSEAEHFAKTFRQAVVGHRQRASRASADLWKIFVGGHQVDLIQCAVSRTWSALRRWAVTAGTTIQQSFASSVFTAFVAGLRSLQWRPTTPDRASWTHEGGLALRLTDVSVGALSKGQHDLRDAWRLDRLRAWAATDRRDATIASMNGTRQFPDVGGSFFRDFSRLRTLARQLNAHALAVMCGGFRTDATVDAADRPDRCPHCERPELPCLDHVLWHCASFEGHRVVTNPPADPMTRRMGWSLYAPTFDIVPFQQLIIQMGNIRAAEAEKG